MVLLLAEIGYRDAADDDEEQEIAKIRNNKNPGNHVDIENPIKRNKQKEETLSKK